MDRVRKGKVRRREGMICQWIREEGRWEKGRVEGRMEEEEKKEEGNERGKEKRREE